MSRNQFVSNASHELKTPLSTMKILLETLLYQENYDPAMQKEFLTDINKEIDRLNRIVSDLLTLVNIDSGGMHLNVADVRLRDIVTEQVKRLSPLARERGIELSCLVRDPCRDGGRQLKAPAGVLQRHRQRHQIHAARRRGARGACPRRQARRGARGGHGHRHSGGRSAPISSIASTAWTRRVRARRAARVSAFPSCARSCFCTMATYAPRARKTRAPRSSSNFPSSRNNGRRPRRPLKAGESF